MRWVFHRFASLDTITLFALMKLRVDVFVVEQACPYPELDACDTDPDTLHLLGYAADELAAYARAMPQVDHQRVQIGRVLVKAKYRGQGHATALMQQLIERLATEYPDYELALAAQQSVLDFYTASGFVAVSEVYLEDGIAHVDMVRACSVPRRWPR